MKNIIGIIGKIIYVLAALAFVGVIIYIGAPHWLDFIKDAIIVESASGDVTASEHLKVNVLSVEKVGNNITITYTIKNESNYDLDEYVANFVLYDDAGNVLTSKNGRVDTTIPAGESVEEYIRIDWSGDFTRYTLDIKDIGDIYKERIKEFYEFD